MSPDSALPTPQRRAWRIVSAFAAILAALSLLVSVLLFTQVQQSRHDAIVLSCRDTNARYFNAIRAIDDLIAKERPKLTPKQRKQLPAARANNVFVFSRVLPVHRDCGRFADRVLAGTRHP